MRIISWNCNMAFRKKAALIMAFQPDILIVQECECPENLIFNDIFPAPADLLWFGANRHKGLAVFSFGNIRLKVIDGHNTALKMIVPIAVSGAGYDFNLFAIWAHNPSDPDGRYIEQVWKAIHYYDGLLSAKNAVLIGDFNSNTIWDRKRREGNHSNVVKRLKELDIKSTYHLYHNQVQGQEQHPTFYLYKHADKPYHLDYCFASSGMTKNLQSVTIGGHADWKKHSDHVPLVVTFNPFSMEFKDDLQSHPETHPILPAAGLLSRPAQRYHKR